MSRDTRKSSVTPQSKTATSKPRTRSDVSAKAGKGKATKGRAASARNVDWDAVHRDYRTAKFTLREMAEKYGVSHQAIAKRAKALEWSQDLAEQIKQATNAKLVANLVDTEVAKGCQTVANAVLVAAEINTQVILKHRTGLQRITQIKEKLLNQIEQAATHMQDLAEVIEMVRSPDENGIDKANDALRKAMGRSSLVDDLKKLAEVDEKVRKGEREAFNINEPGGDDPQHKPKRVVLEFEDVEEVRQS